MVVLRRYVSIVSLGYLGLLALADGVGGDLPEWSMLQPVLTLPEGLDGESALGKGLAALLPEGGEGSLDLDALRSIAVMYHANEYDERAKVLYDWLIASCRDEMECARLNYLAAQLVKEKGDSEGAMHYLEASVAAYDEYGMALVQLGESKFKVGEIDAAAAFFERAKLIDGEQASAYVGLARVFEQRGQTEQMVEELESILRFDQGNSVALALLSQLYARLGDGKRAYEISESIAYSSSPSENDPWFEEVREAIFDVQRLDFLFLDYFTVNRYKEAMPYLERMEALDPGNARYSRYRAVMYMGSGYHGQAEAQLRQGLAKGGDAAVFYPLLVKCLSLQGKKGEAEREAKEAVGRFGSSGELNLEWARLLMDRQAFKEAMVVLEKGLESDPYQQELHFTRARLGMRMGKSEAAQESLAMIQQLAPMDAKALVRAALVYMEAGRFGDALPLIQNARRAAPYFEEAEGLLSDAYFELAVEARAKGDVEGSLLLFDESLELRPQRTDALGARVQVAVESGRLEEAESALRAFMDVVGDQPGILLVYGDVLFRSGKLSEARSSWNAALRRTKEGAADPEIQRKLKARLDHTVERE